MKTRFLRNSWINFLFLILIIIGLSACGNGDDVTVQLVRKVDITGQVTGSGGLGGVKVSAGGISTTTDPNGNGFYRLENVPVPSSGRIIITYEKTGYATYQRSLIVGDGSSFYVGAKLAKYTFEDPNIDPSVLSLIGPEDPNERTFQIVLPAGSLLDPNGEIVTANVTVNAVTGDPTTPEGKDIFPGDFMAAEPDGEEPSIPLESVAFAEITITDDDGNELTELDPNKPATIRLQIPDSLQSEYNEGDEIAWWSYDEDLGTWVREDADPTTPDPNDKAVVIIDPNTGIKYFEAMVTHFTWWNVDRPLQDHACICVSVVDEDLNPLSGMHLLVEGVTYNGRSSPAITDTDGIGCVTVKRSSVGEDPESVKVWVELGDLDFVYTVTDPNEGDPNTGAIYVPTDQGSTIDGIDPNDNCLLLENYIIVGYPGEITGTVRRFDANGPVVSDLTIYANFETLSGEVASATSDSEGKYIIESVPLNNEIKLFAMGYAVETVTVTDPNTPAVVNFILPNQAPTITFISRDKIEVMVNAPVIFTVSATDLDGNDNELVYSWQVDAGDPNSGDGTIFLWTAPSDPKEVIVKVTVTDERGKATSGTMSFVVVSTAGETQLTVTVLDNPTNKTPVSGVYVVLHNENNRDIQSSKTTDPNGVVDFGAIGRSRATLTFLQDDPNHDIKTYVNVLVGDDLVYYFENDDENSADIFDIMLSEYLPQRWDALCDTPQATINISFSGDPNAPYIPLLITQPGFSPIYEVLMDLEDFYVCEKFIQSDEKLSLLSQIYGEGGFNILKYGFLLDQDIVQDANYTINLDMDPNDLIWNANIADTSLNASINSAGFSGIRKGVPYQLGKSFVTPPQMTGTLSLASAFPCDYYLAWGATVFSTQYPYYESNIGIDRHNSIPDYLTFSIPDYDTNVSYNIIDETFTWSLSGDTKKDVLILAFDESNSGSTWQVFMDPNDQNLTSWEIADLSSIITWFDPNDLSSARIFVYDFKMSGQSDVNGFDDIWSKIIQEGINPFESAIRILCRLHDIQVVDQLPTRR